MKAAKNKSIRAAEGSGPPRRQARPRRGLVSRLAGGLGLLGCLSLLVASPAAATQTHLFKETFGPVQQQTFVNPIALDTIQSSGDLLVAGGPVEKGIVTRFKANGEADPFSALGTNVIDGAKGPGGKPCAEEPSSCDATPKNAFLGLNVEPATIAVDESGGPGSGDIYLLEPAQNQVEIFASTGAYLGKLNKCGSEKFSSLTGLAVDASGNIYTSDSGLGIIHKFVPTGNPPVAGDCSAANNITSVERPMSLAAGTGPTAGYLFVVRHPTFSATLTGGLFKVKLSTGQVSYPILEGLETKPQGDTNEVTRIAISPAGKLFVMQEASLEGRAPHVDEYDASGAAGATLLSTLEGDGRGRGIAFAKTSGDIYLGALETVRTFGATVVTQPGVETAAATGVTPSRATLNGTINPDGQEVTSCEFEYVVRSETSPAVTVPCAESPAEIGTGHTAVPVHAVLSGLTINREYIVRLIGENSNNVPVSGGNQGFQTEFAVNTGVATEVTGTAASLNGTVNPDGGPVTACQFEYLAAAQFAREVQTISIGGATGGTFKLALEGVETGAAGEAKLTAESTTVGEVSITGGAWVAGEVIVGSGIQPGTTIASVDAQHESLTLSQPAESTVPAGKTAIEAQLGYDAPVTAISGALKAIARATGAEFSSASVTEAAAGHYAVEFQVPSDVPQMTADGSGLQPGGTQVTVATQTEGRGFRDGEAIPCAESEAEIGSGEAPVAVHAPVGGLAKGTEYRVRLGATNTVEGHEYGAQRNFTTLLESNVETKPATNLGGSVATLNGIVKPGGEPVSECSFAYVDDADYQPSAPNPYEGGSTVSCAESEAEIGDGAGSVPVHADVTGLDVATVYHFHLVANPNGTAVDGGGETLRTGGPTINNQWAAGVGATEATLAAAINPNGSATTYHIEYGKEGGPVEVVTPESGVIGAGSVVVDVEDLLEGLAPETAYHYRVVATSHCNSLEPDEACSVEAGESGFQTVTTRPEATQSCPNPVYRGGAAARLPDCRAYEMVSPAEKNGANVGTLRANFSQVDPSGERMTFASVKSFAGGESGPFESQYLANRVEGAGWQTRGINPPRNNITLYPLGFIYFQFKAFSPDLCTSWFMQDTTLALVEGAPAETPNLYQRDLCGGGYELLTKTPPPSFHLVPVETFYWPEVGGFSANGRRTVFRANDALTPNAAPETPGLFNVTYQVYEAEPGAPLRLVSVLPSTSSAPGQADTGQDGVGTPNHAGSETAELRYDNVVGAVSADATRVFWTSGFDQGTLYLRVNSTEPESDHDGTGKCTEPSRACTYPVSGLVSGSARAKFLQGNTDSTRAIFAVEENLYEFETKEGSNGLETEAHLIAGGFQAFMGAGDEVNRVYFVSKQTLASGGREGAPNLYFYERGHGFKFVAALSPEELREGNWPSPVSTYPEARTSRVSPDGEHVAFTTITAPTGYDNSDVAGDEPDGEVYTYDAMAGSNGRLLCVSCNPSGTRPVGRLLREVNGNVFLWGAGEISGWNSEFQPTRALSENGNRVFFNSYDALLPQDTNGAEDVYEWEAPGEGSCTEGSAAYFAKNGGCLYLISSGKNPSDSEFFDATPQGKDVFFATLSSLLPQDKGLIDVYDARVDGGLPEPAGPAPACEGEACQGPASPPNDATPASSAFQGAGNLREPPKTTAKKRCPKGKVRRKGHCVARHHKKKHARHHKKKHARHHKKATAKGHRHARRAANRKQEVAR